MHDRESTSDLSTFLHPKKKEKKKKNTGKLVLARNEGCKAWRRKGKTTKKEEAPEREKERKREEGWRHSGGSSYITLIVAIITIL